MVARVGTLAVGTVFETTLTGRRGTVRAQWAVGVLPAETVVDFGGKTKRLHPDVRVRVVEAEEVVH